MLSISWPWGSQLRNVGNSISVRELLDITRMNVLTYNWQANAKKQYLEKYFQCKTAYKRLKIKKRTGETRSLF